MRIDHLLPSIEQVLNALIGDVQTFHVNGTSKTVNDTGYEAFLFVCLLEAVQQNGWIIGIETVNGKFVAPGQQCSMANTPRLFSVARFRVPGSQVYDAMIATKVGTSSPGGELEADILVIAYNDAEVARSTRQAPPFPTLRVMIEAKNYMSDLGRMEAKSFIGSCQQIRETHCIEAFVGACSFSKWVRPILNNNFRFMGRLECFDRVTPEPADVAFKDAFIAYLSKTMKAQL